MTTTSTTQAVFVAPVNTAKATKAAAAAHINAGLDVRDVAFLNVNIPTRGLTAAQDYTKRTGKPYPYSNGHISIE